MVKNLPASAEDARNTGSIPGSVRSLGGGNGNPLVFLPGKFHGQRSLAGYSPWGRGRTHTEHACVTKSLGTGMSLMCQISKRRQRC